MHIVYSFMLWNCPCLQFIEFCCFHLTFMIHNVLYLFAVSPISIMELFTLSSGQICYVLKLFT